MDNTFVAAVLEGIENTLEELIGHVQADYERDLLGTLREQTAAIRRSFEQSAGGADDGRAPGTRQPGRGEAAY